jgi:polyphosphate glucokinase
MAERQGGTGPVTLAVDIGGTGLKAAVLDSAGDLLSDRVRVDTPHPAAPDALVARLCALVAPLPDYDRVSVGFPGMVRAGRVRSAPNLVRTSRRGDAVSGRAVAAWSGFDLAGALAAELGKPTKVVNDASMQGAAVVSGCGLELVVTLGTGFGTALFWQGKLTPHLEFAHHPFRKRQTYEQQLGDAARRRAGNKKWSRRVRVAVNTLRALSDFDHVYLGGGNSGHLTVDLGPNATVVDNLAGILGGIRLWDCDPI